MNAQGRSGALMPQPTAGRGARAMPADRPCLEVLAAGVANTVQDRGRFGLRAQGVPVAGAADPLLLACANRLLGNADGDAGIEIPLAGPTLVARGGPLRVALAGDVVASVRAADGPSRPARPWATVTLQAQDQLHIGAVRSGVAYLALPGGCDVPVVLGSRSTYARAGLGGIDGHALQGGDRLPCGPGAPPAGPDMQADPWVQAAGPLRVMLGPQDEAFEPESLATFLAGSYRVTPECDRMGMRLEGPALRHRHGADIVSEGVVPGAIQVPGNGQPIILLADAQTVGGYTKIATVIRADLPRLAHARPGQTLRFAAVTRQQARQAWVEQQAQFERWARSCRPSARDGQPDLGRLAQANLVSGMIDAHSHRLPWETA